MNWNDGQWHHFVWTRSEDGNNRLYLDGRLIDQTDDGGGTIVNDRPMQIGGDPHQKGRYFHGSLAEVAIYPTILSAERVKAHALAGGVEAKQKDRVSANEPLALDSLLLEGADEVSWKLLRFQQGWCLGSISYHGKPLELKFFDGVISSHESNWITEHRGEEELSSA